MLNNYDPITRRSFLRRGCLFLTFFGIDPALFGLSSRKALAERVAIPLREAMFYERLAGNKVRCGVCFRGCTLKEGGRSFCRNKENMDGSFSIGSTCTAEGLP